jgi:hypothetical protein
MPCVVPKPAPLFQPSGTMPENCKTVTRRPRQSAKTGTTDRRTPKFTYQHQAATSQKTASARPAGQKPPKARPAPPQSPFRNPRPAPAYPPFDWRAFITSRMNTPWPQPAYSTGAPSQPRPAAPPPSRPNPIHKSSRWPAYQQVNLWAWARPRLSKSLLSVVDWAL